MADPEYPMRVGLQQASTNETSKLLGDKEQQQTYATATTSSQRGDEEDGLSLGSFDMDGLSLGSFDREYDDMDSVASSRSFLTRSMSMMSESSERLWANYNVVLDKRPLVVKSVTALIILGLGDLCGQAVQLAGSNEGASLDYLRMARFALMGLILQAPFSHFFYLWLDHVLPPTPKPFQKASFYVKLAIDQLIQAPLFLLLVFLFQGFLRGMSCSELRTQLRDQYVGTLIANWKLWLPAQTINIAFCPPRLRVLFMNVVFFVWSIVLSLILNG